MSKKGTSSVQPSIWKLPSAKKNCDIFSPKSLTLIISVYKIIQYYYKIININKIITLYGNLLLIAYLVYELNISEYA